MTSWIPIPPRSPFSLRNIPFGIISRSQDPTRHVAVAIGDHVLDMSVFAAQHGFDRLRDLPTEQWDVFSEPTLNAFAALGRPFHRSIRQYLQDVFHEKTPYPEVLKENRALQQAALLKRSDIQTHLPMSIGDYTDFFAGRNHAQNVGTLFRGAANALQPNYNHLPVAYHGRASSVVVSGTPLHRPIGQMAPAPGASTPVVRPSAKMDIELEMGMFLCRENALGQPIPVQEAEDHIFGYVLMNDWSARDIHTWEYVPLGPFVGKNFGTSISPWVVLADALESCRSSSLPNDVELQDYLHEDRTDNVLDITLEVTLTTAGNHRQTITRTSSKNLLWSWPQMIAHHTLSGCNMRVGDLLGSGTISGPDEGSQGSLLELTKAGKCPLQLDGGEERRFLEDGDTVTIQGWAGEGDDVVGFGECSGQILAPFSGR